ncbi:MAG: SpoVR family protein [Bacteroidetes bacterium GWF2_38_335]|nr:MAG: SpoVR family protein [Bacteroidetes bacterium GWF2_38_335]OFY80247.1 MAG: SpoVR family protein [Bacteroidetes bacterium RIFOXYA12_FULL_38_20]HBS88722.1 SpoVR family protein [Bacteroidales bacterium]
MELISQRTKKIMEECKARAKDAGLSFDNETLEYIVTNKDMVELSPKVMIPTLYDYWVHDVEVLKGHGKYKLYPNNPYETVINSRPAISFYNDNNPDWMNIMIFYHVLAHIDFFQNNKMFERTWNDDFVGQALADKRLIASLRSEYGRWVDYTIEFTRNIDNLVGYFDYLAMINYNNELDPEAAVAFYFDVFLQDIAKVPDHELYKEIDRYNSLLSGNRDSGNAAFFADVKIRFPEFQAKYEKYASVKKVNVVDVMQFVHDYSPFLNKEENSWMKLILNIVRNTSVYFQPQIRTKIINEGWASYWHDNLFRTDPRIAGHEVGYSILNAGVTSLRRVGLNPYAIGLRLIEHVEKLSDAGRISREFELITGIDKRNNYNKNTGKGKESIFKLRKHFSDFTLINSFVSQDFVDEYDLFVVGQKYDQTRNVIQYYVKSKKAADYKQMLIDSLYHPPRITVDTEKTNDNNLYLVHHFEGKQLVQQFIPDTLLGIEYLWGAQVQLETTDIVQKKSIENEGDPLYEFRKVIYTIKDKKVTKTNL